MHVMQATPLLVTNNNFVEGKLHSMVINASFLFIFFRNHCCMSVLREAIWMVLWTY